MGSAPSTPRDDDEQWSRPKSVSTPQQFYPPPMQQAQQRIVQEQAVQDLIRYSLVPTVILPAITPALESALMQMVPAVLSRAVSTMPSASSPNRLRSPAAMWSHGVSATPQPPQPVDTKPLEDAVNMARLRSIRAQVNC